jgi:hypothetical protein
MPRPLRTALAVALACGSALVPGAAQAQLPQPRLQSVLPPGGQAGQTIDVTVRGLDLEGVNALWFDHPGLRAFHLKGTTFRVAIPPGTPVGQHDVRAVGPYGVSNARVFVIGDRPERPEAEPNNLLAQANPIARNTVVTGEIGPTDIDCFSFEGKKGERVFVEVWAARIDSRLDALLRVYAPNGTEIAETEARLTADPFVDLTLPADGRYTIKLHDVIYAGSPDFVYRLSVHDGPHLDSVTPAVAAPGVATTFTLLGRNLGGEPCPGLNVDGRPVERKEVTLHPAALGPGLQSFRLDFLPALATTTPGFPVRAWGSGGWSNPVTIAEATEPVVLEQEPNNDAEHPQMVAPPCDIAGVFGTVGDVDIYRFRARKGEVWRIEASAERLGSPADPFFVVQRIVEKAPPQDLATGDDLPEPPIPNRFPLGTVDAAVRWQAPDDGVYQVVINDLFSSQRGDLRFTYRLTIRPERPDFALFVVPSNPNLMEAVTVRAGSRALGYVMAHRFDGFNRPIQVEAIELPPGVSCEPVVLGATQTAVPIVFEAAANAKLEVGPVRLLGRSLASDRRELLDYTKAAPGMAPERVHEAISGALVWPPGTPNGLLTPAPARATRGFILAVREEGPFSVSARPGRCDVAPGGSIELTVNVTRNPGFTETVQLSTIDLPPNTGAANGTIAKDQTSGTLKLSVPANALPGIATFVVLGTGPMPFSKDPNAKQKPNITVFMPSNPITINVRK